jgi:hypothetical protein
VFVALVTGHSLADRVDGLIDKVALKTLSQGMPEQLSLQIEPVLCLDLFPLVSQDLLSSSLYSPSSIASRPEADGCGVHPLLSSDPC